MKKSFKSLLFYWGFALVTFSGVYSVFLWWVENVHRPPQARESCAFNLRVISRAVSMYVKENDGYYFPNNKKTFVSVNGEKVKGWTQEIQPNLKSSAVFICHTEPIGNFGHSKNYTDFWLNENLAGLSSRRLTSPQTTFLIGEGNDGTDNSDVTYNLKKFPATWLADKTKPPFRHIDTANYLFADGHVAWITPKQAAQMKW